jgi:hypothetical protein
MAESSMSGIGTLRERLVVRRCAAVLADILPLPRSIRKSRLMSAVSKGQSTSSFQVAVPGL